MKTILHVQSILENTIGFWRADTLPTVDHIMIIAGIDYRVTRIIWDMDDGEGAPYGECRCRVIVARCDGQNDQVELPPNGGSESKKDAPGG